jgi:hypothetical protein
MNGGMVFFSSQDRHQEQNLDIPRTSYRTGARIGMLVILYPTFTKLSQIATKMGRILKIGS